MLRLVALKGRHFCQFSLIPITALQGVRQHFTAATRSQPLSSFTHCSAQCTRSWSWGGRRAYSASAPNSGFFAWYLRMLDAHPLTTKCFTAAQFFALSDMTAQGIAYSTTKEGQPKEDWDKARTVRMLGIGMCLSAPVLHVWFNLMSRAIPKTDVISAVKKVMLGQILFAPIFNCAFFSANSFAQGENVQQAFDRIKRDLIPTWQSGILYWPILDFITFRYLPVRLQVLFNNACSFIWTIYLTSMAGKKAVVSADTEIRA